MELACDILHKNEVIHPNKINSIKKEIGTLQKNLINIKTLDDFLVSIKNSSYIKLLDDFVEELFKVKSNKEMIDAILMAYCISLFSDKMFDSYKTRFEQKLILAANKVILILEKFINDQYDLSQEFYITLDHYFSLYKIWKSSDSLQKLNNLFDQIEEQSRIIDLQIKKNIEPNITKNKILLDELFSIDPKYATRILLHNYNVISVTNELEKHLWSKIKENYYHYYDEMFLIIVAELRIKLIPLVKNPIDRKKIYYNIDIEEIIKSMSETNFSNTRIAEIINTFGNKILKINQNTNFKSISKDDLKRNKMLLLDIFELFYKSVNAVKTT